MSGGMLMPADVAAVYFRERGFMKFDNTQALLDDINVFMACKGLSGSSISKYDIARYVIDLLAKADPPQRVETPEVAQWEASQREGYGDDMRRVDELMVGRRVASMNFKEFAENRRRFGLEQDLLLFLGGNGN